MIYLKKGQALFNNQGMVVLDPTGYYEDGATVVCAMFHSPDEPVCSYEAKYIAYGEQVYNITDEKMLIEEIKKIDPNTLIGKTKEDIMVDKMIEKIETVDNPTPKSIPEEDNYEVYKEKEESLTDIEPAEEELDDITEINENNNEAPSTTITTEEIIPEVIEAGVETEEIIPEVIEAGVETEEIISPEIDKVVSKLKSKRKIV